MPEARYNASRVRRPKLRLSSLAVAGLMAGSFTLNFLRIAREGFGDKYYAAAVKSMLSGWHNFLFASFDPGGFVTVDKPAPGLWIQTLSAAIFGFKGWSIILPQALAGALSVGLLYALVKRSYGVSAGLFSALIFAVTPVSVAVNRTNQLDSLLLVTLLLAALAIMIATERSDLKWLLVSLALIGVGFNIKMFAAYTVLPAFLALYIFGSRLSAGKKAAHLALGFTVLTAVTLSWALFVDLTPKDKRPYIGGSRTNSVIELAVDYNGINRLIPQWLRRGRFGGAHGSRSFSPGAPGAPGANLGLPAAGTAAAGAAAHGSSADGRFPAAAGMRGGLGGFETGRAGVFRLFNQQMAGQASWWIVFGLIGAAVAASGLRKPLFGNRRSQSLLLWTSWFFTLAVYFSTAGFFHRYYLNLIAPAIAALSGITFVELWQRYRRGLKTGWFLPPALLAAAAAQILILAQYADGSRRLIPIMASAAVAVFLLLTALALLGRQTHRLAAAAAFVGLAGLLIAPLSWSMAAMEQGVAASMPAAGPNQGRRPGAGFWAGVNRPPIGAPNQEMGTHKLVAYLKANRQNEKFLLAVPSARLAWDIILETGDPVMAMGGFMGADRILTVAKVESLVKSGEVRYFLAASGPGPAGRFGGPRAGAGPGFWGAFGGEAALGDINKWLEDHGQLIPDEAWRDEADMAREMAPWLFAKLFPFLPSLPVRTMARVRLKLYDLRPWESPDSLPAARR